MVKPILRQAVVADTKKESLKSIKVTKSTYNRLVKKGTYDMSMDDIIVGILDALDDAEK